MPEKTTKPSNAFPEGRTYHVDGKTFQWYPLDDNEQPQLHSPIVLPLRLKLGVIRKMADRELEPAVMFEILDAIAPHQSDRLDELDLALDFEPMFSTWQDEYNLLTGASLGE